MVRVESLLSARLFLVPQLAGGRIYFISNLSGRLTLYAMDEGGSIPEPLLPPDIALQNPELIGGLAYHIFPKLAKILVMIDKDGDENYQPMIIPIGGGFPEPASGGFFEGYRVHCTHCDPERGLAYFSAESKKEQNNEAFQVEIESGRREKMGESRWGCWMDGVNETHTKAILTDTYTVGDHVLYLWSKGEGARPLYGKPLEQRAEGETVALSAITGCQFTAGDKGLLFVTALFSDTFGLGYLPLSGAGDVRPVAVAGTVHEGAGELVGLRSAKKGRYLLEYNIDGCSWLYEGTLDEGALKVTLDTVVCGRGTLSQGVMHNPYYEKTGDRWALSFCTATSPTQIYTIEGADRRRVNVHTRERLLGIPDEHLAAGEDASFPSFDGRRVSARLYLPSPALGFAGRRPLVYYVHGGPQGQERPNFAWFSMPLIQFLTLRGFAVFVPNVRGSTGYGLAYTKKVDHDWGGDDRLDHIHAMKVLSGDARVDVSRAAVIGRSYGGYMTLMLASRHPELWAAAVDMFGPYDLLTFMDRIPETWKPYFAIAVGDPQKDRDFLVERSPRSYMDKIRSPLLVIQGANDPRVVERESRDVVEQLRAKGKDVEYLMFSNEGHDVLKFENLVRCYDTIAGFFAKHLRP
jgi:pimeloyl-ACP methyl ester carboxylesterase